MDFCLIWKVFKCWNKPETTTSNVASTCRQVAYVWFSEWSTNNHSFSVMDHIDPRAVRAHIWTPHDLFQLRFFRRNELFFSCCVTSSLELAWTRLAWPHSGKTLLVIISRQDTWVGCFSVSPPVLPSQGRGCGWRQASRQVDRKLQSSLLKDAVDKTTRRGSNVTYGRHPSGLSSQGIPHRPRRRGRETLDSWPEVKATNVLDLLLLKLYHRGIFNHCA